MSIVSVTEVKKKWKHLRDQYRKELKKKPTPRSGAASEDTEWIPQWKYYNLMRFLQDEVLPAPSSGNLSNPANLSQDSMSPLSTINDDDERTTESRPSIDTNLSTCDSAPRRSLSDQRNEMLRLEKEKLELIKARIQDKKEEELKNDEDYMFFMSMLPPFKRLTNLQKLRFRHKVSEMILEMTTQNEYANMFENNTPVMGDYVVSQSQPQYFSSDSHNAGGSSSMLPCASTQNIISGPNIDFQDEHRAPAADDGNENESSAQ